MAKVTRWTRTGRSTIVNHASKIFRQSMLCSSMKASIEDARKMDVPLGHRQKFLTCISYKLTKKDRFVSYWIHRKILRSGELRGGRTGLLLRISKQRNANWHRTKKMGSLWRRKNLCIVIEMWSVS